MTMGDISSVMSFAGTVAGSVTAILTVLAVIVKPVRTAIVRLFSDIEAKKKLYASVSEAIAEIKEQKKESETMHSLLDDIKKDHQEGEACTKKALDELNKIVKEMQKTDTSHSTDIALLKAHALCTARDALTRIYDLAMKNEGISDFQKQNFLALYDVYCNLGGNSYVHQIHDEILTLPRK